MMIDIATNTRINALHKSLTIAFLAVAIVISGLSADLVRAQSSAPESMLTLTPEEQAWLKNHPEIVLGTTTEYSPMVFKRVDGTHDGMLVDIYEEVSRHLNTRIRLHIEDPWAKVQEKGRNREIDGLAMGGRDPSRDVLYNATDVIVPTYFSVFARSQDEYRLSRFADLKGMRIGYKRAAQPTIALLEKLPSAILMPYDGHEALTQALLRKEIDVIVAWISYDHWRKEKLQGTIDNILLIEEYPIEMVSHIRKDWPELASILNKTIASLQQDELPRIINKWFGRHPRRSTATRVPLTSEERAWLSQNRTVRVRIADWPPYQIAVDDKPLQGIVIEYLKLIKERTGVNFKLEVTEQPFAEFLEGMKRGQGPDMTPIIVPTPEREQYLSFTEPYLFSPYVIFTREEEKPILDISGLVDKTLAVPRGHFVHEKLVGDYPEFDLVLFDSDEKALQAVAIGNADAYIGNLTVASHIIHQRGFYGLQVTSSTPFQEQALAMGIRNDWPELSSILGKALAGITEEEKTGIRNKYLAINFEPGINKTDVLNWLSIVVGLSAFVMLVFVVWNKQLSQKVKERTDELMETESRFRATFEQAAVGVAHVSLKGKFLRINKKFCEIVGYSKDEMLDLTVQDIAHPDDLQADLESARRVLNNEIENYSMDNRYNRKDGSIVWINLTVSLLFDDEDKPNYFVAVAKDISDRKNAEFELEEYQDRLKALATQLTIAEEMERRRIAVELHDNVGQALALVRMQIAAVRKFISDSKQAANLDEVSDCLRQTIRETRDLIFDLSPPQLNEIGLSAAISEWLEEHLEKRYDIRTEFVANGSEIQLDEKLRSILFRNIRELVTNAIKHSQAERVNINMNQTEDHVTISITDDGTGFNAELKAPSLNAEGGFGLFSVRERMADMGGSLEIVSEPGQGTEAILYLPLTMDEVQRRNWS
ncbi:diguanylate cyclase/phosphodiesterase (GGDEF & EAL domains) with PAS/PAC sensor(s) [Olavius algarvensis associated proteobacterium Delta 3]|nr:diguanylate cyclase/phosphodiesterase (GGDEF & EAL domains) with PAS/PAC sensor(s) [Olavius algarvensis associated proteobacterium Delta 3]